LKNRDNVLHELQQISYNYSLYRTGDLDLADEISMKTIGVYLLKSDEINDSNAVKWIVNTSKIHIQSHFRIVGQEHHNLRKYKQDLLDKINSNLITETDYRLRDSFREVLHTLSDEEMKIILFYFHCNKKIRVMVTVLDMSYDALRKKISRIKQKLKAETLKKLGVIATKKIVTPKINDLIVKFLQKFKENLEKGTLDRMYYYFSEVDLKIYNPTYEIKKIIDYEIELHSSMYKVWVIFKNQKDKTDSFFIKFYVNEKNHLKILIPPQKSPKVFELNENSEEGKKILQMLNSATTDSTGISKFSSEELEKILNQIGKNQNPEK